MNRDANLPKPLGDTWEAHLSGLVEGLRSVNHVRLVAWGRTLAATLAAGGRLLIVGNGGSAAQAQHLAAELTGRFDSDRRPLSALALHAETSTLTAIANDFGFDEVFARQVSAHGRQGDVLLALSTSGRSPNVIRAVKVAREIGMATWALTGPSPCPVGRLSDEAVEVRTQAVSTIQEGHLAAVHVICRAVDGALAAPLPLNLPAATSMARTKVCFPVNSPGAGHVPGRRRLTIVGDVLLDLEVIGRSERLAPEAPVPVIRTEANESRPGGAGMCAMLAAEDGCEVRAHATAD
jgi:D-beta-D-heptose 7-phosphate kinase/D-beta-D-heptose 1-phosphate adenosyltransferase